MLEAGDFFVGPYPPGSKKRRRIIVITDELDGECTVVCVYTSTSMSDDTTLLVPGDHPEITQTCCVVYEESSIASADAIRIAVELGALTQSSRLSGRLLATIQEGVFESLDTPIEVVEYCTDRI